jgi:hypothetical protein
MWDLQLGLSDRTPSRAPAALKNAGVTASEDLSFFNSRVYVSESACHIEAQLFKVKPATA